MKMTEDSNKSIRRECLRFNATANETERVVEEKRQNSERKIVKPNRNASPSDQHEMDGDDLISEHNVATSHGTSLVDGLGFNYSHIRGTSTLHTSATKVGDRQSQLLSE